MNKRTLGSMLMAGAAVLSLLSAPVSNARPNCVDNGSGTRRCETNGSTSIKAVPNRSAANVGIVQRRGVWNRH